MSNKTEIKAKKKVLYLQTYEFKMSLFILEILLIKLTNRLRVLFH